MNTTKTPRKCLLIDDEFHALELTANYIERLESYEVAYKIRNPLLAEGIFAKEKIDLVFLDINMPQLNGMELLTFCFMTMWIKIIKSAHHMANDSLTMIH